MTGLCKIVRVLGLPRRLFWHPPVSIHTIIVMVICVSTTMYTGVF